MRDWLDEHPPPSDRRYVTIFGEDADKELAKLHGLEVDEGETQHIGSVDCPRCGYQEKREAHFCSRCGRAMRAESATTRT